MSQLIQLRRGLSTLWTSVNPVLAEGEPGYETDTGREKRGNGVSAWEDLPYVNASLVVALTALTARVYAIETGAGPSPSPAPSPTPSPSPSPTPAPEPLTAKSAARLVDQASFGVRPEDVTSVLSLGYAGWVDDQLTRELSDPNNLLVESEGNAFNGLVSGRWLRREAIRSPAQLKAKAVYALQNFIVMNQRGQSEAVAPQVADCFRRHAFGNFYNLLREFSTSWPMAKWLTFYHNEGQSTLTQPDENYAREVMQLFSIGLIRLKDDGTPLRNGELNPSDPLYVPGGQEVVQTYGQADVRDLAKVFTGWGGVNGGGNSWYDRIDPPTSLQCDFYPSHHTPGPKTFLGTTIQGSNDGVSEMDNAIAVLFNHPSHPPFICKQMIQRLVTSNPSPAYVARVVAVYKNNGSGVRGDMKAMWRAILLDTEARSSITAALPTFGKIREGEADWLSKVRVLAAAPIPLTAEIRESLGQNWQTGGAFGPPSVFNFFTPYFAPAGYLKNNGLVAPEMQTYGENSVLSFMSGTMGLALINTTDNLTETIHQVELDYAQFNALRTDPSALVDTVSARFQVAYTPARKATIVARLNAIPVDAGGDFTQNYQRVEQAMLFVFTCPERMVQK